jgi:predicted DNA-binding transcriptional regulator AlpA
MPWVADIVLTATVDFEGTTQALIEASMSARVPLSFPQEAPPAGVPARYTFSAIAEGDSLEAAMADAREQAEEFAAAGNASVASVKVLTVAERSHELTVPLYPELVAQPEIAIRLGRSRAVVNKLVRRRGFPPPAVITGGIKLWVWSAVETWEAETSRPTGRPQKAALA